MLVLGICLIILDFVVFVFVMGIVFNSWAIVLVFFLVFGKVLSCWLLWFIYIFLLYIFINIKLIFVNDVFFVIFIWEGELIYEFCFKVGGIKNFFWLKFFRGLLIIEIKVIIVVVVNW